MRKDFFPGIEEGERILYFGQPHPVMKYLAFGVIIAAALFIIFGSQAVLFAIFPSPLVQILLLLIPIAVLVIALWWINILYTKSEFYITDRRVVKFIPTTPFHISTRALFWDHATKLKTFYRYPIVEQILGIGDIQIHSKHSESDNIDLDHLKLHRDLGNFIDKVIYTFNNEPQNIPSLREFVPRPRGKRY